MILLGPFLFQNITFLYSMSFIGRSILKLQIRRNR